MLTILDHVTDVSLYRAVLDLYQPLALSAAVYPFG